MVLSGPISRPARPKRWASSGRAIATVSIAVFAYPAGATATFNEIKAAYNPSDTLILDRRGEVLHRLRTDATVRRGQWVALADISPALRTALVLSEDKRF
jgi:penicillin-binding protein 1C